MVTNRHENVVLTAHTDSALVLCITLHIIRTVLRLERRHLAAPTTRASRWQPTAVELGSTSSRLRRTREDTSVNCLVTGTIAKATQIDHTPRILRTVEGDVVLDYYGGVRHEILVLAWRSGLHDHDRHGALHHTVPVPCTHIVCQHLELHPSMHKHM